MRSSIEALHSDLQHYVRSAAEDHGLSVGDAICREASDQDLAQARQKGFRRSHDAERYFDTLVVSDPSSGKKLLVEIGQDVNLLSGSESSNGDSVAMAMFGAIPVAGPVITLGIGLRSLPKVIDALASPGVEGTKMALAAGKQIGLAALSAVLHVTAPLTFGATYAADLAIRGAVITKDLHDKHNAARGPQVVVLSEGVKT